MENLMREIECLICENHAKTHLGCDGMCEHDEELTAKIKELFRLAEIGRAFEKALKEKYGFINFTRYAGAVPEKWEMKESEYNDVLNWAKASSKNNAI